MGTLILKMMSAENRADDDPTKSYSIKSGVKDVDFIRNPPQPEPGPGDPPNDPRCWAMVYFEGEECPETFPVTGNCYVMNENGKTIASFGPG